MSRGPRIQKIKFLAVVADIRKHPNTPLGNIAHRHKISTTSAVNINAAGTWGNYQTHKKASVSVRDAAKAVPKVQRAKAAGLKPVTREQRQERELQEGLDRLAGNDPRSRLRVASKRGIAIDVADELDTHNDRLGAQLDLIRAARREAAKAERLSKIAIWISVAALILAVVK